MIAKQKLKGGTIHKKNKIPLKKDKKLKVKIQNEQIDNVAPQPPKKKVKNKNEPEENNGPQAPKKFLGTKRKFDEPNDAQNNSQEVHKAKKFKKGKNNGQNDSTGLTAIKPDDSGEAVVNNTSEPTSTPTEGTKPEGETVTVTVKSKNKMNVKADKNWEALLKTLTKDTPKPKPENKKKKPRKIEWIKPHPKQLKKKSENETSKTAGEGGPKKIKKEDVWFDDVDDLLIEGLEKEETDAAKTETLPDNPLVKDHSFEGATKVVAMDCEMVGVGEHGVESVLARVSIVNRFGHALLDKYVKPREKVTDYRTHVSGIRPSDLKNAEDFEAVQQAVHYLVNGRILVGHALHNDMQVLFLSHPKKFIRDTARYKPFRKLFNGRIPSLKNLTAKLLSVEVQTGEHSSVQDAQAAMRIYTMHRTEWEKTLKSRGPIPKKKTAKPVHNPLESDSDS